MKMSEIPEFQTFPIFQTFIMPLHSKNMANFLKCGVLAGLEPTVIKLARTTLKLLASVIILPTHANTRESCQRQAIGAVLTTKSWKVLSVKKATASPLKPVRTTWHALPSTGPIARVKTSTPSSVGSLKSLRSSEP